MWPQKAPPTPQREVCMSGGVFFTLSNSFGPQTLPHSNQTVR